MVARQPGLLSILFTDSVANYKASVGSEMKTEKLRPFLERRALLLAPSVEPLERERFIFAAHGNANKYFLSLLEVFDGFAEFDTSSWIMIWPVKWILKPNLTVACPEGYVAFGDVETAVDLLYMHISDEGAPVIHSKLGNISEDLESFWEFFVRGAYDFY